MAIRRDQQVYTGFTNLFPARACYEVSALPKDVKVEIKAVFAV